MVDLINYIKNLPQSLKVVLGEHDLHRQDETFLETKELNLKNIIVHEGYGKNKDEGHLHDIALLELEEEVDLSVYTPVCLPSSVRNRDNTPALAIGKGRFYLILFTLWNCAKLDLPVYGISKRASPEKLSLLYIVIQAGARQQAGYCQKTRRSNATSTIQGETAGGPAGHAAGQPD